MLEGGGKVEWFKKVGWEVAVAFLTFHLKFNTRPSG